MPDKDDKKKKKQNNNNASPGGATASKAPEGDMKKDDYPRHNPQNAR